MTMWSRHQETQAHCLNAWQSCFIFSWHHYRWWTTVCSAHVIRVLFSDGSAFSLHGAGNNWQQRGSWSQHPLCNPHKYLAALSCLFYYFFILLAVEPLTAAQIYSPLSALDQEREGAADSSFAPASVQEVHLQNRKRSSSNYLWKKHDFKIHNKWCLKTHLICSNWKNCRGFFICRFEQTADARLKKKAWAIKISITTKHKNNNANKLENCISLKVKCLLKYFLY